MSGNRRKASDLFFSKTSDYLNVYLPKQANRSYYTVKAYRVALAEFFDYIAKHMKLPPTIFKYSDCTFQFVLAYSQYLQEDRKLSESSVNQKITAIKQYLRYVSQEDISLMQIYLSVNDVPTLKITKKIRPVIESNDLGAFFEAPKNNRIGNRDRTILILLYDTAVRVSEIAGIRLGDIDLRMNNPIILIHGKGRKERTVIVSDEAADYLRNYIKAFHNNSSPETPLFYTKMHGQINQMSVRNIQRIVEKYGNIARETNPNIPETHPHMLRRTRATDLYRDGVPLNLVSTFLGHAQLETTTIYATPSQDQLREASNRGYDELSREETPIWEEDLAAVKAKFGLC